MRQQARREKERVEEGLKLSRERAAERARLEAAALDKKNREKAELEEKKEVRCGAICTVNTSGVRYLRLCVFSDLRRHRL